MNLGARIGCWSGASALDYLGAKEAKAGKTSPLVAMWDAIENAGWGVHDSSATVWKDLTRSGLNLSKIGSPTFDEKFVWCDNSNYFKSNKIIIGKLPFTIESVFCPLENTNNLQPLGNNGNGGYTLINRGENTWGAAVHISNAYQWLNYGIIPINATKSLSYVGTSGYQATYMDGVLSNSGTVNGSLSAIAKFGIGKSGSALGSSSIFSNVRIYDRVLEPDEIAHNYAVDKARFGLT